jgi:5-methylcytosine-specific restriction protein A
MRYRLCVCGAVKEDKRGSVCPQCQRGAKRNKARSTTEHGYDYAWRRLSERVRAEHPLCQVCEQRGDVTPATEVHHIIPVDDAPWLRLERSNLVSICNQCHNDIHAGVPRWLSGGGVGPPGVG